MMKVTSNTPVWSECPTVTVHVLVQSVTAPLTVSVPKRFQSITPQPVLLQPVAQCPASHIKSARGTGLVSAVLLDRTQNNCPFDGFQIHLSVRHRYCRSAGRRGLRVEKIR